jgi:hypothetical protein
MPYKAPRMPQDARKTQSNASTLLSDLRGVAVPYRRFGGFDAYFDLFVKCFWPRIFIHFLDSYASAATPTPSVGVDTNGSVTSNSANVPTSPPYVTGIRVT